MLFLRTIDDYTDEERLALFNRAGRAFKDTVSSKNRRLLRRLVRVLRSVNKKMMKKKVQARERRAGLQALARHRRELAKMPPWRLRIIGQTDVASYVTAPTNVTWAQKKKRRP
jgi:hypothetical protein